MSEPGGSDRVLRSGVSGALVALAALAAVVACVLVYVRVEVLSSRAFANRAVAAVHKDAVREVIAREVVVQLLERGSPDLVAARPLLQSAVSTVIGSRPFAGVIRLAADHGHRLLFNRSGANVAFDASDAGTVITSALRTLAPSVAKRIPPRFIAVLLTLRKRSFAVQTLRVGEKLRVIALIVPAVALLLLALALIIAPDRRAALTRFAIAAGVAAVIAGVALELSRLYVTSHVVPPPELSTASLRAAVGGLWDAYFGDLMTLLISVALLSWIAALVVSAVLAPYSAWEGLKGAATRLRRPVTPLGRTAAGAGAITVAVFLAVNPTVVLRTVAFLAAVLLVYFGMGELLAGTAPAKPRVWKPAGHRVRAFALSGAVGVAAIAAAIVVGLSWGTPTVRARETQTCNGYAQLCSRRLDQVVFAGTHNSMSAADSPGWLIANQDRNVAQQLQDGIRLFKISTHYGVQDSSGHVRTDIKAAGQRLNRVSGKLSPQAREALARLGGALGLGSLKGEPDIWLCHSLCELGATRMVDFLTTIRRFIDLNPGQVIVLFDEDYVAEKDLRSAFQRAGLFSHLATLEPGKPLPTLGQLIQSGHYVLVFAQKPPSASYPWDMDAFSWIQDTPLGAVKPAQFSCRLYRGRLSNPLLMMNDWADLFPPRLSPNIPLVSRQFLLRRADQCRSQRGRIPDLILTDFYDRGDVVGTVRALNGLGNQEPAPTVPVPS